MATPPVPSVPDLERKVTAVLTASAGPIALGANFPIYGAGEIAVLVNGQQMASGWTLSSASGAPLPWADAQIMFDLPQTATITILGSRRPYTQETFIDGGATARALNLAFRRLTATDRELYDAMTREIAIRAATDDALRSLIGAAGIIETVNFASKTAVQIANIAIGAMFLQTAGYASSNDGGGGLYVRAVAQPSHDAWIQSSDGAFWELIPNGRVDWRQLGASTASADCGPAIRKALAFAMMLGVPLYGPPGVWTVGPDPAAPVADGNHVWCLRFGNNTRLSFAPGCIIKQANGAKSWQRCVTFGGEGNAASNIEVAGTLEVDANVANINAGDNNEHMHGVFIWNVTGAEFDSIVSRNARGDNLLIGGASEVTTFSDRIHIKRFNGKVAGRKNLVFHYADNLRIDYASLDNTGGGGPCYGADGDDTDQHCFDVEPDGYTGAKRYLQSIGYLYCAGSGVDFSASVSMANAEKFSVRIDHLVLNIIGRTGGAGPVKGWAQYGCDLSIGRLDIRGLNTAVGMEIYYGAKLSVDEAVIRGSCSTALAQIAAVSSGGWQRPNVRLGEITVINTHASGYGVQVQSADVHIDKLRAASTGGIPIVIQETSPSQATAAHVSLGEVHARDSGDAAVVSIASTGSVYSYVDIGDLFAEDSRGSKVSVILSIADSVACNGVMAHNVRNNAGVTSFAWGGSAKWCRIGVNQYICLGTPESQVPASVGAIAQNLSASNEDTVLYVKDASNNGGNTGWHPVPAT